MKLKEFFTTERVFLSRITSRIISKILQKKKKQNNSKTPTRMQTFLEGFCLRIETWFSSSPILKRYHPQIFLLFLFLLILHPGLHSRFIPKDNPSKAKKSVSKNIPPRPEIYPQESVHLVIDTKKQQMNFYIKNNKVAVYPIAFTPLPVGSFKVIGNTIEQGICLYIALNEKVRDFRQMVVLSGRNHRFNRQIQLDDDLLEILYPYLRNGTPVKIV